MSNIQILKVNEKGEILAVKYFSFDKFDDLLTYVKKMYKKITPAFVFCLNLELQAAIQVLRDMANGKPHLLYRVGEGIYYFRSGNLVFSVDEEV